MKNIWKRKDILVLFFVSFMVAVGLIMLFFSNVDTGKIVNRTSNTLPTPAPIVTKPAEKTQFMGIDMNDFFKTSKVVGADGALILFEQFRYKVVYFPKYQKFIITIKSFPFSTTRLDAERDFLYFLDISKDDACKLTVSEVATKNVSRDIAGVEYPMSFCNK